MISMLLVINTRLSLNIKFKFTLSSPFNVSAGSVDVVTTDLDTLCAERDLKDQPEKIQLRDS